MTDNEDQYNDTCIGGRGDHNYEVVNEEDPPEEWVFWCKACGAETWN